MDNQLMHEVTRRLAVLALLASIAGNPVFAAGTVCPRTVLEKPSIMRNEPDWKIVSDAEEKALTSVGIYLSRPPDERLSGQVPDTITTKRVERNHWRLLRSPGDRYWLGCNYANTTVMLVRELGNEVQSCTVEYSLMPNGRLDKVRSVACR